MKKLILFVIMVLAFSFRMQAQMNDYVQEGEFGITVGLAHYFGDLNNRARINRPKMDIGGFVRKQFGNYTSVRLSGHFAKLGYSDIYSKNEYDQRRNLSFNTNIFEIALQGDFNFFKFIPTDPDHSFTPYATLGIGFFTYDPYAYYHNQKVYLRPLHTEGETFYKGRKEYGSMALCFPLGFGVKYAINDNVNLSFEIAHRFTTTDYIDDVSTTYIGADKFPSTAGGKSIAGIMQDRSFEVGPPIGIEGRQRGFSKQKDQYIIAEIGVSFNITSYQCPTVNP
ncbi:MAG TPA: DUF6089 family protein [Hanamia sp.]|nr:DUF6089 family protein [Hanamia sp.]